MEYILNATIESTALRDSIEVFGARLGEHKTPLGSFDPSTMKK
jgi:hypothetical protein